MTNETRAYLPALRGHIGDWIYYCALMTLSEVCERVSYAKVLHPSKKLSQLIQRALDESTRVEEIASYLIRSEDRFFNALVVAVYGGSPDWHQIDRFKQNDPGAVGTEKLPDLAKTSVGFLSLSGKEQLFALDGQHRLAGIKRALALNGKSLGEEEVPIIFVAHRSNKREDMRRTRNLFTTLNKTARPVTKNEIIALDEADVMALSARYLIEDSAIFKKEQIDASRKQANLPKGDAKYWMTIINLYDALELLFRQGQRGAAVMQKLKFQRPSDPELQQYFERAEESFRLLGRHFDPVGRLLAANDPATLIRRYRTSRGGHVLFRPIGVLIFFDVIATLLKAGSTLEESIKDVGTLPVDLAAFPYAGTIWDDGKVNTRMKALVRDILLYRLGHLRGGNRAVERLTKRYAEALEVEIGSVSLD